MPSALAWVMFAILLAFTVLQLRLARRNPGALMSIWFDD